MAGTDSGRGAAHIGSPKAEQGDASASTRRRTVGALAVLAVVCVAGVGVAIAAGSGDEADSPRYAQTLVPDLCALRADVSKAGTEASPARTLFFDRLHEPLHALARDLNSRDRAQAARLLEAKQVIESLLSRGAKPEASRDVDPLITETVNGLTVLGAAPETTCSGSAP